MRGPQMQTSLDECADELRAIYLGSRIYDVKVDVTGEVPNADEAHAAERALSLIIKSVHEPSVDEVPILNAILESFEFSEIYEYERVAELPEGDRAEHLARFIVDALSSGRGVIMVAPNLMGVSLAGRLPDELADELDYSSVAQVSVRADNTLYLPLRDVVDGLPVEIVAKANSGSSYERVQWLSGEARRRGLELSQTTYLPDNRSIMEYVTSIGSRGYVHRVPVTKLASIIAAIDRCTGANLVERIRRPEVSVHTVYAMRVGGGSVKRLVSALNDASRAARSAPLLRVSSRIEPFFERGLRESMAEVLRRLGLLA